MILKSLNSHAYIYIKYIHLFKALKKKNKYYKECLATGKFWPRN